jgi:type I restriction enzyme R subunit
MDKSQLSERDICTKFITPAVQQAGWDVDLQIREEVSFTKGRIIVRDKVIARGKPKRADYILYYKENFPIALIEAKDNKHSVGDGMQQGLEYAETLDIPFVFSSNGDAFIAHDRTGMSAETEKQIRLDEFPSPQELYQRYLRWKNIDMAEEQILTTDYYYDTRGKSPRYYQQIAINRTIEAVANDQKRIMLVMATGTGKTYTAFQIMWRLWKSGAKKRILFLADRNILIDQAKTNDFIPFGDKMTKISNRQIDKSYELYLSLYQAVTGNEEEKNIYKQFSPDFFDLIIVDECHRGSARADSAWREILEYFDHATQIGLTATPKETKDVSNIDYFGEPVYTYSLKQGIEDGFLAPYKVVRYTIDRDVEGYRPEPHKRDIYGEEVPDEVYYGHDFDRKLIIDDRTKLVAKKVTEYLEANDEFAKTIVFCIDIEHAERMRRALINENQERYQENSKYIMRITGDNEIGKAELDGFIDPESKYPVIVTTSKLLTTGVDAQTCKLVVLDAPIKSMAEFKQIVGRGTRLREDHDKFYFTIMDFRNATDNFADPDFDGEPVQIYEPVLPAKIEGVQPVKTQSVSTDELDISEVLYDPQRADAMTLRDSAGEVGHRTGGVHKYHLNDVEVLVSSEKIQFYDEGGKLVSESLEEYSAKNLKKLYPELVDFQRAWEEAENKSVLIHSLVENGFFIDELLEKVDPALDVYDLVLSVAYKQEASMNRSQRAQQVRDSEFFHQYQDKQKELLLDLLSVYEQEGIVAIEDVELLRVEPFTKYGSPVEILGTIFSDRNEYLAALADMKKHLYKG